MNKPQYNKEVCNQLTFDEFKEAHKSIDYFKYLTDAEWNAEYATATGGKVEYVESSTDNSEGQAEESVPKRNKRAVK